MSSGQASFRVLSRFRASMCLCTAFSASCASYKLTKLERYNLFETFRFFGRLFLRLNYSTGIL